VFRAAAAVLIAAGTVLILYRFPGGAPAAPVDVSAVSPPPAESRPPDLAPGIKWMPESPRYQYARRLAYAKGTDFSSRLDLSTTRWSRNRVYRASIHERQEPVALHAFQHLRLRIESADGGPVSGAQLNVNGGMPEHGHGLPSRPQARAADRPGEYLIEGLQFSMPGWWELHVYISKDRRDDIVTFNLVLE
jgi:hypothetical protein